jgi:hypothetical protein
MIASGSAGSNSSKTSLAVSAPAPARLGHSLDHILHGDPTAFSFVLLRPPHHFLEPRVSSLHFLEFRSWKW